MAEINTNLDTTPLPPNNLVAQDPVSAELAGYVRTKTFGRDVRESIARSIELNSTRSKSAEILANETVNVANDLTDRFNQQIGALTEDAEVIDARGGKATLGQRLDETDEQLAQIATNVKDFGAMGDGLTDDWLPIQNALDSMVEGGTLFFPEGNYIKSDVLTIKHSNVKVFFSPNAKLTEQTSGISGFTVSAELNNISFENLNLFGLCDAQGPAISGITLQSGVTDVKLSHCSFDGYTICFIAQRFNERISIDKCRFYNSIFVPTLGAGGYGIVLQGTKDTQITNNYFDGSVERHHIYCGRNPVHTEDVGYNHVIANNIFKGENKDTYITGFEYLVKIMGNQNVTLSTNVFDGGVGHVMVTSAGTVERDCENIIVTNNTFMNIFKGTSVNSGVFISNGSSTVHHLIFSNNVIRDCDANYGIRLDIGINSKIDSNLIFGVPQMNGIEVEKYVTNTNITNNQLEGVFARGVYIGLNTSMPSKNVRITGNTLKGTIPCFLNFVETGIISDNEIISSRFQCIYFNSGVGFDGAITGNTLIGGNAAIRLNAETTGPVFIHSNVFKDQTEVQIDNVAHAFLIEPVKNASGSGRNLTNVQTSLTTAPINGTWVRGDIVWNALPGAGAYMGWVCTSGGSPGTWKGYGLIQA